jgi:hypothetical protein
VSAAPALPGFDYAPFLIPQANGTEFELWEEVTYTARLGDSWTIPEGFRTDFATIPSIVSWAIPKLGAYTLAAIVHDALCTGLNDYYRAKQDFIRPGDRYIRIVPIPTASAIDTDAIFRRIALDMGTDRVTAQLLWVGVRWGALFNPARRPGWLKTAPKVLGWSLLFSPVLVPATVIAGVGQGLLKLTRLVFGRSRQ